MEYELFSSLPAMMTEDTFTENENDYFGIFKCRFFFCLWVKVLLVFAHLMQVLIS